MPFGTLVITQFSPRCSDDTSATRNVSCLLRHAPHGLRLTERIWSSITHPASILIFLSSPLLERGGGGAASTSVKGIYDRTVLQITPLSGTHSIYVATVISYCFWLFRHLAYNCEVPQDSRNLWEPRSDSLAGGKTINRKRPGERRILWILASNINQIPPTPCWSNPLVLRSFPHRVPWKPARP